MKQKVLALLCAVALLVAAVPTITASAATSGEFSYSLLTDGTAVITGYSGHAASLTVPAFCDGYRVTAVADEAFSNVTELKSVTLPDTVREMGESVFYGCDALKTVTLPKELREIGDFAFSNCESLEELTIPAGVTRIGVNAFENNFSLRSLTLPGGLKEIGNGAFMACQSLRAVSLPDTVQAIGPYAFYGCSALRTVTVPSSVSEIDGFTFYGCSSLNSVVIPESVVFIGERAFGDCYKLTKVYYGGTAAQRYGILTGAGNELLVNASWTFKAIKSFPDVRAGDWYAEAVNYVSTRGYMTGFGSGRFGPAADMQRQDFVLILARVAGANLDAYAGKNGGMRDVPKNAYYAAAVAWGVENGIITGYTNGKFGVGDPITREQVCTILHRYKGSPEILNVEAALASFPDRRAISPFAREAVAWSVNNGVMSGMGSGKMAPTVKASRAQIATIVMRMDQQGML